MEPLIEMK